MSALLEALDLDPLLIAAREEARDSALPYASGQPILSWHFESITMLSS